MVDKLLTLKETAETLGLSEEEVVRLVEKGHIPAYQIGGMYLRFREEQIIELKGRGSANGQRVFDKKGLQEGHRVSTITKIKDFLYLNDFYIVSAGIVLLLLYIIFKSIK